MKVKQVLSDLRATKQFKEWHTKNKESKLVHVFVALEHGVPPAYDIGFFDAKKNLMTSFVVDEITKEIQINESDEVFIEPGKSILPLDESKIKIDLIDAENISQNLQKEKYKAHLPVKAILLLQNLEIGQVWNVTYITKSFQTLNMKIDSETGKIIEEKLHQIFSFDK
jgi:hypothetical protein